MQKNIKFQGKSLTFHLPTEADQSVFDEIFRDNEYRLIEQTLKKAKHPILDIGAHIGLFSVYAATLNPKTTVYAFEPAPQNFQSLKDHLKQNHIKNIQAKNLAVTDQKGTATLHLNQDSHNHSFYLQGTALAVNTTTLEEIIKKNPQQKFSVAKIDCEGAEFPIILNTPTPILQKIHTYFIEYHHYQKGHHVDQLQTRLKSLGYKTQKFPSKYQNNLGFLLATSSFNSNQ